MTSPSVLPLGREAWSWVRQGGNFVRTSFAARIMYGWQSVWFERNRTLQRRLFNEFSTPHHDPIFILGLWRSGTTHLHDMLGACPGLIYPATWQCMSPASFLLRSPPIASKGVTRPMDNFTIDALSPQEDEFALLALGVPSAYLAFFDPRRLPEIQRWLEPERWTAETPAGWVKEWRFFIEGVARGRNGRMVLKSPGHTFRIRALTSLFPKASTIWIVRDPEEIFLSNQKMWTTMFQRYALWPWNQSVLDDFLCRAMEIAARCLGEATRLLARESFAVVHFKTLTEAPVKTVEALNQRLLLGDWNSMQPAVAQAAASKENYRPNHHDLGRLSERARQAVRLLNSAQQSAVISHGL